MLLGIRVSEIKMSGTCSLHRRDEKFTQNFRRLHMKVEATEKKASIWNILSCLGLRLRQHFQFLTSTFFDIELIRTKETAFNAVL